MFAFIMSDLVSLLTGKSISELFCVWWNVSSINQLGGVGYNSPSLHAVQHCLKNIFAY